MRADPPSPGELLRRVWRGDRGHFDAVYLPEGMAVEIADELGTDESEAEHSAIVAA